MTTGVADRRLGGSRDGGRPAVFDVARVRADFPILAQHGPRQAARLSRQRRDDAEAAGGASTRWPRYYETTNANVHRGVHHLQRARDAWRSKTRARRFARSSTPAATARSSSPATPPRASTSSRSRSGGRGSRPATRCSSPRWSTTRTSCPGSCVCAERGARLRVAPIDDRGELIARRVRAAADRPHAASSRSAHMSNALGTINPVARHHRSWRTRAACRCCVDGSQAASHMPVDVQALGVRLLRRHRPQAVRPDRHRRALRTRGAARGDAAVPGRRRHDRVGDLRAVDLERPARTSSRRARRTSPGRSASARRSTTSAASASTRSAAHEQRPARVRHGDAGRRCRACA